jgi:hypothetical protein
MMAVLLIGVEVASAADGSPAATLEMGDLPPVWLVMNSPVCSMEPEGTRLLA